jgi:hypothetical protein
MMNSVKQIVNLLVPWINHLELNSRNVGVQLSSSQVEDARAVGVMQPEEIRVVLVDDIPSPEHPALEDITNQMQFHTAQASGLTARYGVYITEDSSRPILLHEFVHVSQYESFESVHDFLEAYIEEIVKHGYYDNSFEREARRLKR